MVKRFLAIGGATLALLLSSLAVGASPASAWSWDTAFFLTYNSYSNGPSNGNWCGGVLLLPGAYSEFHAEDKDLANNYYTKDPDDGSCSGYGQVVKNNSGGARNVGTATTYVWFSSYAYNGCFCGKKDTVYRAGLDGVDAGLTAVRQASCDDGDSEVVRDPHLRASAVGARSVAQRS